MYSKEGLEKRAGDLIYFNEGLDPALNQDQSLVKYWFHTITNVPSAYHYLHPGPLSRKAIIQVPTVFWAITVIQIFLNVFSFLH